MGTKKGTQTSNSPRISSSNSRHSAGSGLLVAVANGINNAAEVSYRSLSPNARRAFDDWLKGDGHYQVLSTVEIVGKYLEAKRAKGLAEHSLNLYSSLLGRFVVDCPELPMAPEPIERFLEKYSCANTTRRTYYRILKRFYRFMAKREPIFDPMDLVELPKAPHRIIESLDPEELGRLLAVQLSSRDRAAILVMSGCGFRQGEARSLTPGDIYVDRIKVKGKTGERLVPASPDIVSALLALCDGHKENEPIFWGSYGKRPLGSAGFERLTKEAFHQAGITGKRASPHTLRHTFGRICIVNGMDISVLQVLMGHTSITTTAKYLCFATREVDDKYRLYAPFSHLADHRLPLPEGRLSLVSKNDILSSKLPEPRISL